MNTQLVKSTFWKTEEIEHTFKTHCNNFLNGVDATLFQSVWEQVIPLLADRWVLMVGGDVYCHQIKALWWQLSAEESPYDGFDCDGSSTKWESLEEGWARPTTEEQATLTNLSKKSITKAPFGVVYSDCHGGSVVASTSITTIGYGFVTVTKAAPIFRLKLKNNPNDFDQLILLRWLEEDLVPECLKGNKEYLALLTMFSQIDVVWSADKSSVKAITLVQLEGGLFGSVIEPLLLTQDHIRADLKPYVPKMLEDTEQGHWDLWKTEAGDNDTPVQLSTPLVACDPASRIIDGYVGIDFGTKSTVVVCQEETTKINPMRIGTGDLCQQIASSHYENPTIIELNDVQAFVADYQSQAGRPFTKWQDVTVSHTALNALINSRSADYNAYISDLKQWAGTVNRRLKAIDKQGHVLDLPSFLSLSEDDVNPIEMYAYYLGLYINNQHNGIFMNYILSFPVTYELEIRDKIIASFHKGLKKSLPQTLHNQPEKIAQLSVVKGASEPAAYAIVALQSYEFEPEGNDKVFYGVFDFGGGTTDFDFGIYREASSDKRKERRFDYVLEHFGAGGDRYLGGENLLALLAFEVFKSNQQTLLETAIQFMLPPECSKFPGSEMLLSQSREAKMNMTTLIEALRPFWEGSPEDLNHSSEIALNLTDDQGKTHANFALDIDVDALHLIIKNRITKGVTNFFEQLRLAFNTTRTVLNDIDKVSIFLAGNSSKSEFVKAAFEQAIENEEQSFDKKDIFTLYPPLDNKGDVEKPTGKTGVAFGLIETREGGDILVLDHNMAEGQDIPFKYYLGESRKKKFKQLIGRDQPYQTWVRFVEADYTTFELYYSAQAQVSTNKVAIGDSAIKKKVLKLDKLHDDAWVYIRLVKPTQLEFVVALECEVNNDQYVGKIHSVDL